MTTEQSTADEVSPDSLMSDFRGRPVVTILAFTVIVHVVLVGVFSVRYLKNEVLGEDTSSLSEEERLDLAVDEATKSLRKIAERHGISPQDLSERFAKGDSTPDTTATSKPANPDTRNTPPKPDGTSDDPTAKEPKSAIEKELKKKADGPDLPDLPPIEEEEDLFK